MVWNIQCLEDSELKNQIINELMSNRCVCRTPGLLIICLSRFYTLCLVWTMITENPSSIFCKYSMIGSMLQFMVSPSLLMPDFAIKLSRTRISHHTTKINDRSNNMSRRVNEGLKSQVERNGHNVHLPRPCAVQCNIWQCITVQYTTV